MLPCMSKLLSLSLVLSLFAAGCSSEKPADPANNNEPAKNDAPAKKVIGPTEHEVAVRHAKCGCSIEGIGHCGNYIEVEGQYVPLIHESLGKMEFCKQKDAGVDIKVAGQMVDGKYVAKQWKLTQK